MAIHATVDGAGYLSGFYTDATHAAIPPGAFEITLAQYRQWVAAQGTMVWSGSRLTQAPATAKTAAAALAALDALRQKKQALGVMFKPGGPPGSSPGAAANAAPSRFATDDASQAKLLAEFVAASTPSSAGSSTTLRGGTGLYKAADGSFVTLSDDDVKALAAKVRAYVVACYAREQALAAAVAANPATDITAGWPSNI